jgi:hypothetical protein
MPAGVIEKGQVLLSTQPLVDGKIPAATTVWFKA